MEATPVSDEAKAPASEDQQDELQDGRPQPEYEQPLMVGPPIIVIPAGMSPLMELAIRERAARNGASVMREGDDQPGTPSWQRLMLDLARIKVRQR